MVQQAIAPMASQMDLLQKRLGQDAILISDNESEGEEEQRSSDEDFEYMVTSSGIISRYSTHSKSIL